MLKIILYGGVDIREYRCRRTVNIEAAKRILRTLYKKDYIGAKHTSPVNTLKALQKHERGEGEKTLKQLKTLGYVIFHPTGYGTQISLNKKHIKEIEDFIDTP